MNNIDNLTINTLRMLSVDMIGKANSGHPGLPLGAAPMAYALLNKDEERKELARLNATEALGLLKDMNEKN